MPVGIHCTVEGSTVGNMRDIMAKTVHLSEMVVNLSVRCSELEQIEADHQHQM